MNTALIEPPARFLDPVTWALMSDPVKCSDGRTYDRNTAEQLRESPFDRTPFSINVDDVTIRGELFEAYPEQVRLYREGRVAAAATQAALLDPAVRAPAGAARVVDAETQVGLQDAAVTELTHLILRGLEAGIPPEPPGQTALPRAKMAAWVLLGASGAAALKSIVEPKLREPVRYPLNPAGFDSWFQPDGPFTHNAEYLCGIIFDGKPLDQKWGFFGCAPDPIACRNLVVTNECEVPVPEPLYGSAREEACLTAQRRCTHQYMQRALKAEAYYQELAVLEPALAYNRAIGIGADAAAGVSVAAGILLACHLYLGARGQRRD